MAQRRDGVVDGRAVVRARGFGGGGRAAARFRGGVAGAASEVGKPQPSGESVSPAAERWPAPAASEMAELRPGVEAA